MKINFIWNDYLIITTVFLMLSVQMMTNFVSVYYQNVSETKETAKNIFFLKEANPLTFWAVILSSKFSYIIYIMLEPAFLLTFYILVRIRKIRFNSPLIMDLFTLLVFIIFLMNFLNDLPQFIGYIIKAGIF